jgi:hypothetical protein
MALKACHTSLTYADALVPGLYWVVAECGLTILAVCLPSIFVLFRRGYQYGPRALLTSREFYNYDMHENNWTLNGGSKHGASGRGFQNVWHTTYNSASRSHSNPTNYNNNTSAASLSEDQDPLNIPLSSIHIHTDWNVGTQAV